MDISFSSPINFLSYGICGRNILAELDKTHNISLFPIPSIQHIQIEKEDEELVLKTWNNRFNYNKMAPSLRLWHQFELFHHVGKGLHCAFPIFELDEFHPISELPQLKNQDKILVCSQWAKEIVERQIKGVPVSVVPLGVDRSIFPQKEVFYNGPTIFLNIGKWEVRKSHDFLIEVWKEFTKEAKDVELWMVPQTHLINEQQEKEWVDLYTDPTIKLFPRLPAQKDIGGLMAKADCYVGISRAEGFNLPMLEAMSVGLPIVTTDYSAHTEFCNEGNANLVEITELETAYDGHFFKSGIGQWASLDVSQFEQTLHYFRKVHKEKQEKGVLPLNEAGIETAKKFSWSNTAKRIEEEIS